MKIEMIRQLVDMMPPANGLYRNNPVIDPGLDWKDTLLSEAERDPGFPWRYVHECVSMGLTLPRCVTSEPMRLAFIYLTTRKDNDHLRTARIIRKDTYRDKATAMEIFLLRKELTLQDIALLIGIHVEAVKIYEGLFFNVRDRLDDPGFARHIAFPASRQVQFAKDYLQKTDPMSIARHFGHDGDVESVLRWIGDRPSSTVAAERSTKITQDAVCGDAAWLARAGAIHQPTYALNKTIGLLTVEAMNTSAPKSQTVGSDLSNVLTLGDGINASMIKRRDPVYMEKAVEAGDKRLKETEAFFNALKKAKAAQT